MNYYLGILVIGLIQLGNSFNPLIQHFSQGKIQYQKISGNFYKKYEPALTKWPSDNQCLFFTGGSSSIPSELYNSFLTKLSTKNISISVVNPDIRNQYIILQSITHNKPITLIAHSSGATTALEACNYLENIENVILIDPVDTRFFSNEKTLEDVNPRHKIENLLFINAEKSYEWSIFPFKIPFIPVFSLPKDKVISNNKLFITAKDYGHCDILDYPWGKIMHNTLSRGIEDRDELKIERYHNWIGDIISNYIENKNIHVEDSSISYRTH